MNKLNYLFWILSIVVLSLLSSCNNLQQMDNQNNFVGSLNIGHVSTIPYSVYANEYVLLPIQNNSNQTVFSFSIGVIQDKQTLPVNNYLDATSCDVIAPNQTCYLKIFANQESGYQLDIVYKTANNHKINLKQIINFSNNYSYFLNSSNSAQDQSVIISDKDNWVSSLSGLSIPVLLSKSYSKIEAKLGNKNLAVICSELNTSTHNMCTILIPAMKIIAANRSVTINAYNESVSSDNVLKSIISYSGVVTITPNYSANIISSELNAVINPSDGNHPVTVNLLNNGGQVATGVNIFGITPLQIQNNTCTSTLNTAQSCTFDLNINSSISGQSSVIISYNNASGNHLVPLNVVYMSIVPSPLLNLMAIGSFSNVVENLGNNYLTVNITNSGNIALQNLQFNDISTQNPAMSSFVSGSTCTNGQSLAVGDSCNLILSYNPTTVESGMVTLSIVGTYYDQLGRTLTYSNSSLAIPYSSVTGATFTAVGDFGMFFTSPVGGAGKWNAVFSSPFKNTTIYANSMLVNNGTYVMTLNDGSIEYSSINGLFWEESPLGGTAALNLSTCSVIYDGTYYYTCGRVRKAFASVCTRTGYDCIIQSNNLGSSWNALFLPANKSAINDIFYFTNGTNAAYVATIADNLVDTGLVTSTNGSNWLATSSGQAKKTDNNFTPVAFDSINNELTAWNSNGLSSTGLIANPSAAWRANTTSPAAKKVTSALFENGTYVVTLVDGNIYTTTNPSGTYTKVSTNATHLNRVIYANNINGGTYLAVGNTGVNLTATNPNGPWTTQTALITGQATKPNLTGAYTDGSNIWVTGVSTILKSNDATNWITPGLKSIATNGQYYILIDNQGHYYYMPIGAKSISNVTQINNPPSASSVFTYNYGYCVSQNLCFIIGESGTILQSTNLPLYWSSLSSGTTNSLNGMTCNNGTCVIVGGNNSANSGTVLISSNYNNWSVATTSLATTSLNSVSYYNGIYIAVGNNGTIFNSSNGKNWSQVTSGTTNNLNSIACQNNMGCVAVGDAGTILFSAFGARWSTATSSSTNDLLSVACNGVFVAVGKGGVSEHSTTGSGGWTADTFPAGSSKTNNLNAVISN